MLPLSQNSNNTFGCACPQSSCSQGPPGPARLRTQICLICIAHNYNCKWPRENSCSSYLSFGAPNEHHGAPNDGLISCIRLRVLVNAYTEGCPPLAIPLFAPTLTFTTTRPTTDTPIPPPPPHTHTHIYKHIHTYPLTHTPKATLPQTAPKGHRTLTASRAIGPAASAAAGFTTASQNGRGNQAGRGGVRLFFCVQGQHDQDSNEGAQPQGGQQDCSVCVCLCVYVCAYFVFMSVRFMVLHCL